MAAGPPTAVCATGGSGLMTTDVCASSDAHGPCAGSKATPNEARAMNISGIRIGRGHRHHLGDVRTLAASVIHRTESGRRREDVTWSTGFFGRWS
jgi:hypothetical protein